MTAPHDTAEVERVVKGLTKAQRALLPRMNDGELVFPLQTLVEGLPENIRLYREAATGLRAMGLAKHGVLYNEDTGAPHGSGTWLTPLGLAVRAHILERQQS
jgi:hypothetical protein